MKVSDWFGYRQPQNTHPIFPWWKQGTVYGHEGPEGEGWVRVDNNGIVDEHKCRSFEPVLDDEGFFTHCTGCFHSRIVPSLPYEDWYALTVPELMEKIDREDPLPRPRILPQQVWYWPDSRTYSSVLSLSDNVAVWSSSIPQNDPTNAILVFGEGAPWCPVELLDLIKAR